MIPSALAVNRSNPFLISGPNSESQFFISENYYSTITLQWNIAHVS